MTFKNAKNKAFTMGTRSELQSGNDYILVG